MYRFTFSVTQPPDDLPSNSDNTFYWHNDKSTPYFKSNIGPFLGVLGDVSNRNIDLVRIASAVLSADLSAPRSGRLSKWNRRQIFIEIDVLAVKPWNKVKEDLQKLLGFLTGDEWSLVFKKERGAPEQISMVTDEVSRVVLLSGGADSAAGALLSAHELASRDEKQLLVSHWSANTLKPIQSRLVKEIKTLVPGAVVGHEQIHLSRGKTSPVGKSYGKEYSSRSRSLLFISLGLAVASVHRVPVWLPENGYASINPPLSRSRRGSLSTKTTHPKFLQDLINILKRVGAHHDLINPYEQLTKGEMFTAVKDIFGENAASKFLSGTTSCSHTGARSYKISPYTSCGVCFGCVLRQASFKAAGLDDATDYLKPGDERQRAWLNEKTVIPAMEDFLRESFGARELSRLQLPKSIQLSEAENLCSRARDELGGLLL